MSHENVALTRRAVEAFNQRDWDTLLELADEHIEIESRLVGMEGAYRGVEGMRRWWENLLEILPDYTIAAIEELRDHADVTVLHFRALGHGTTSATPVIDDAWQVTRWRDGRITWWRNCSTESEALEAAGL
jgi:ketosteroid isomerase-like protein